MPEDTVSEKDIAAALYKGYEKMANEVVKIKSDLIMQEFARTIKEKGPELLLERGFLPYMIAAAILALGGKEVNRWNVGKLLKSVNVVPNNTLLDEFDSMHYKGHLIYFDIIYFILAIGREPSEELVEKAGLSMGIKTDREAIKRALAYYDENKPF
ncbi:MAG: hypothetical protein KGH67_05235 [Candidatus Micrarchaeota archaeon]|nr:hypothetical protein [Candidatus Micrarchaeota archaeon]MDE1859902.1 hypothetical protein [Candidatus Micrarchaeota archaeon]